MKIKLFHIIILFTLFSCTKEREFKWNENIKLITEGNLKTWIRKAPFENEWDPHKGKGNNEYVITNEAEVFPYMGKFKNINDNFTSKDLYQKEFVIYKDSKWGDLFVYAALQYDNQELYLDNNYSEPLNPFTSGGMNAINQYSTAQLNETHLVAKNQEYKANVYLVYASGVDFLFGFYQQGQLLFEVGFPCKYENRKEGLKKLQQINEALNLNIKEWDSKNIADLEINNNPISFWDDPYIGLYRGEYLTHSLNVNLKNTPFVKSGTEKGIDYIFAYENTYGYSLITFKLEATSFNSTTYEENNKDQHVLDTKPLTQKVFITKQKVIDGNVFGEAETYFRDSKILKIGFQYPKEDKLAKKQIDNMLANLKIHKY